jgi:hypothetical protein
MTRLFVFASLFVLGACDPVSPEELAAWEAEAIARTLAEEQGALVEERDAFADEALDEPVYDAALADGDAWAARGTLSTAGDFDAVLEAIDPYWNKVCQDTTASFRVADGAAVCALIDHNPSLPTYVRPFVDGTCPSGYAPFTVTTDAMCDAAEDLGAAPPACNPGCQDYGVFVSGVSEELGACTVTKKRICAAPPPPAPKSGLEATAVAD